MTSFISQMKSYKILAIKYDKQVNDKNEINNFKKCHQDLPVSMIYDLFSSDDIGKVWNGNCFAVPLLIRETGNRVGKMKYCETNDHLLYKD